MSQRSFHVVRVRSADVRVCGFQLSFAWLPVFCFVMAAMRCCATTKSGTRCSITSLSTMRDAAGRFVAEPLRKGGSFCIMHTILFPREPARACEAVLAYIDLETNSLDVLSGNILEIGALINGSRAMFSTVVNPGCNEEVIKSCLLC